jgi:SAM-dependent methyltransferase
MNRWVIQKLQTDPLSRSVYLKVEQFRSENLFRRVNPYLAECKSILDVGAFSCALAKKFQEQGKKVTALDVIDVSLFEDIRPIVYDGVNFPFKEDSFDAAIFLFVLHHTKDPEQLVAEAKRVARRVIIMEDVVRGPFHKYATGIFDSLLNFEFKGHPHKNKTDEEWCRIFEKAGFRLVEKKSQWFTFMLHTTYVLDR